MYKMPIFWFFGLSESIPDDTFPAALILPNSLTFGAMFIY